MNYQDALQFWLGRINFEIHAAGPGDLRLDRMRALLALLDHPQERYRIVHVAGTKGKGSTAAMLSHVLVRAGYRVGLFTSPHLVHVEERFQVDGQPIEPDELAQDLTEIRDVCRAKAPSLEASLTFFEICAAIGFLHFARRRAELAILEVGLGGRFDSTNVCTPLVAIITSISFDHMAQLGNTLAKIAGEKAGIVKKDRPTISGARDADSRRVIDAVCRERHSRLRQLDRDFRYHYRAANPETNAAIPGGQGQRIQVVTEQRTWPWLDLKLVGDHQAANAALAIAAVEELRQQGLHIPDRAVAEGLAQVDWPARMETIGRQPWIVLDCAHNTASVEALVQTLTTSFPLPAGGRRFLIFASSRDKDLPPMLQILGDYFDAMVLTRFTNNPRSIPPEQIYEALPAAMKVKATVAQSSAAALEQVRSSARSEDLICITGSVFLAGELRPVLIAPTASGTASARR